MRRRAVQILIGSLLVSAAVLGLQLTAPPTSITIDYPAAGSVFPPEITAPTFLWRDGAAGVTMWRIEVDFGDGAAGIRTTSSGERLPIGDIDPRCVSDTNQPPRLTPRQAAAHSWKPDASTWDALKKRSVERVATVTITGFEGGNPTRVVSRGSVTIRTSKDPVGAPIFFRDVPLMPSETEKGVIKPLASEAVRLIAWRLRNVGEPNSRLLLDGMPTCANCHSFSLDGKTLGMDLDGPQNHKGMYTLASISPNMSIRNQDVIEWSAARGRLEGKTRVGFMSQVSPDGQYVVTTVNNTALEKASSDTTGTTKDPPSIYYVANFTDYRFLRSSFRRAAFWHGTAAPRECCTRSRARTTRGTCRREPSGVRTGNTWCSRGTWRRSPTRRACRSPSVPTTRTRCRSATTSTAFLSTKVAEARARPSKAHHPTE